MARIRNRIGIVGVTAALCLSIPSIYALAQESGEVTATVDVATYNILSSEYDDKFPDDTWADRREAAADLVAATDPDILGVQEGQVAEQVDQLAADLGDDWEHFASERSDVSARAVFWKDAEFDATDSGDFRVVDPDVEGFKDKRYGSWVLLRHRDTARSLLVFNVHLPNGGTEEIHRIRRESALTIAETVKEKSKDNGDIPAIVTGDFNTYNDTVIGGLASAPKTLAEAGLPGTYEAVAADSRVNADYASHFDITKAKAAKGPDGSKRLDYIHTYTEQVTAVDWRMVIDFAGDSDTALATPVPSDHHPTASRLKLAWS